MYIHIVRSKELYIYIFTRFCEVTKKMSIFGDENAKERTYVTRTQAQANTSIAVEMVLVGAGRVQL